MIKNICAAIIILTAVFTSVNFAQEMAVPANLQAALFKKIFAFNKTLQSKGVDVSVLSADGSGDAVAAAFKDAGINAKSVKGAAPAAGATVVYVMPGVNPPKQVCAQKGILSISGVASNVETGKVSIGLGLEGGKPKILIHMGQLKAEGQELSADLLKIARVIQ